MYNIEFSKKLKRILIELSEKTLYNLLNKDPTYQESCEKQGLAERDYLNLDLSKEQRETIEKLLLWTDISNADYSTLSYLAGLYDGCKLSGIFHNGLNSR
jgi:hypothetical protein